MTFKVKTAPESIQEIKCGTFVDVLRIRANKTPDRVAYTYLQDGVNAGTDITFVELDGRARAIAAVLQERPVKGERALILLSSGLDYIAAFFGCLYAGVIAIPGFPPRFGRLRQRDTWFHQVLRDARPSVVFASGEIVRRLESSIDQEAGSLTWIDPQHVDVAQAAEWLPSAITAETIAIVQYTSGSTSDPRGVMLSHGNLLHNQKVIQLACGDDESYTVMSWLPLHHDMGLIGTVIHPAYIGARSILMAPTRFLQEPVSWLEAITRYGARSSSAPDFAYDLCCRKIGAKQKASLDLASWKVAINGAEPVRPETMKRFEAAFRECGFSARAFFPSYGLAEATLMVTGARNSDVPLVRNFSTTALEQGLVCEEADDKPGHRLAGCGHSVLGQNVKIVNPETLKPAGEQEIGEIWVTGPSVAQGYWGRLEESESIFRAQLTTDEGRFLRTGDLGFIWEGELFVTGRCKDLIIVRGRNLYPQDLELTIQLSHPAVRPHSVAVFASNAENQEAIVAVAEVERRPGVSWGEVISTIREAVLLQHGVPIQTLALIRSGTIPKTTSGKIKRSTCRIRLGAGELQVLAQSQISAVEEAITGLEPQITRDAILNTEPALRYDLVHAHLRVHLQTVLRLSPEDLKTDQSLVSLGMDSLAAAQITAFLNQAFGVALDPAGLLQDASLDAVTTLVVDACNEKSKSVEIPKAADTRETPLSYGQHGLWVLHQIAPDSTAYILASAAKVRAGLNIGCLREAFRETMSRHQMLRATFSLVEGGPVARIQASSQLVLENHFQHRELSASEALQANQLLNQEARLPFALDREPPVRLIVFSLPDGEHLLLLGLHHIVADLISVAIIVEELNALYAAKLEGRPALLPEAEIDYADFVRWQFDMVKSSKGQRSVHYWQRQLGNEMTVLDLPADRPRPPASSFRGASEPFNLSSAVSDELRRIGRTENATPFMVMLGAFQGFLHRICGQDALCVGTPVNGRGRRAFARTVGYCVNTVVLGSTYEGALVFRAHLARTKRTVLEAFDHQDYPFSLLVEKLHPQRVAAIAPIFQAMFAWQKLEGAQGSALAAASVGTGAATFQLAGLKAEQMPMENTGSQFDLTLMMAETSEQALGVFKYSTDLFDASTISRLARQFSVFLESITYYPERPLANVPMLSVAEQEQLLAQWTLNTSLQTGTFQSFHQLFEEQVESNPESPALVMGDKQLTYAQLNAEANQLARYLRSLEIGFESVVGICLKRCPEIVTAILGIWKAGAAYVPFDPQDPRERLAALIGGAALDVMIVHEELLGGLPEELPPVVLLDLDLELVRLEDNSNLNIPVPLDSLAYVIHTSGSTGFPKGVMIQHRSVANLVQGLRSIYASWPQKRLVVGLNAPLVFDSSVKQLLTLALGHTLCLVPENVRRSGDVLLEYLNRMGVEVLDCTPTMAQILIEVGLLDSGKEIKLLLGGEAALAEMWQKLATGNTGFSFNVYGPTECTVDSTACALGSRQVPAIGLPLTGTNVYLLDEDMEPVPAGAAGEIYIGGFSVGRGYRNNPLATAERFLPDPFTTITGTRMYRSGDRGRYSGDGMLEFIGRTDRQVKVRGFRIELGEIQSVLCQHPGVRDSAVVLHTDSTGTRRLIGYVVAAEQHGSDHYRQFVAQKLPEYMVPSLVLSLPGIPTNANGKRDYTALSLPDFAEREPGDEYVPPQSDVEKYLVNLWASLLHVSPIGINNSFFSLGGDSLQATRMVAQIQADFAINVPLLALFFQEPTIAALSRTLARVTRQSPVLS